MRQSARKPMRYTALIYAGGVKIQECTVSDISEGGARLETAAPDHLPERFTLILSRRGGLRRRCRAVWRSGNLIGVQFEQSEQHAPSPPARTRGPNTINIG